jgi:hypothetical protein
MITIEDLKDFDTWKQWKNGEVQLVPMYNEDELISSFVHCAKYSAKCKSENKKVDYEQEMGLFLKSLDDSRKTK